MYQLRTLCISLKRAMYRMYMNIGSFSMLTVIIFFASCNKELSAPEPLPFELGTLTASKNEVALDAAYKPDKEAVILSWGGYKNSLVTYTIILTSGSKTDSIAQNTVGRLFTNSELNGILLDKLGLTIGVTAEVKAKIKATIPSKGITAESNTITVKVTPSDTAPNLVQGGKFNAGDESKWTLLTISSPGVALDIADGKAVWKGGSWGHVGIYQAVQVEANKKYQVNLNISGSGASDTWFQVYVGRTVPQQGQDYTDGGSIMGLSTWDGCGKTPFSGPLTSLSCGGGSKGVVEFSTAGTVYLVIRGGGADLGTTGISVDNVEMTPIQ